MDAPHGSFICSRNGIAFEHHGNKGKKTALPNGGAVFVIWFRRV